MRYTAKIPAIDPVVREQYSKEGWTILKEPKSLMWVFMIAIPIMFVNGCLSLLLSGLLYPPLKEAFWGNSGFSWTFGLTGKTLVQLVILILFILVHEMIHASMVPHVWRSDKTVFGLNGFFGFVYTTEVIRKNRFFVISLMPLFVLSLLLPLVMSQFGMLSGFAVFLFLINAMGSSVDCYNVLLVSFRIPKGSVLVSNGLETYYRAE